MKAPIKNFSQVDEVKLQELISIDPSGGLLRQLTTIFNSEMQNAFIMMKEEYNKNNFDSISKLAHRLRSTSLNLGMVRLGEIFKQLEYLDFTPENKSVFQDLVHYGEVERDIACEQLRTITG